MLTEQFIASVGVPNKAPSTNTSKDASIFVHQFQPLLAQQQVFKKSATAPNGLAVSSTHIFAAQRNNAVVHVYSREKGNQEAIVPYPARITCLELACDETVLVLGTAEGRIFLWEVASGRQISTSQAHLQAVTALALDGTGNFLLSASIDSSVHIWSIPNLLSFGNDGMHALSPIRSFTSHRAEVIAIATGRGAGFASIAVTASSDKTCLIWDYHTNMVLRTYLLSAVPTCLAIDAAERAVYVGYEDGSIQPLDLYTSATGSASIHNASKQALAAVQPPQSTVWQSRDDVGATLSISVSFDGCTVLTGHENGTIRSWDVGKNGFWSSILQNPLPGPVCSLSFLPVRGFTDEQQRNLKAPAITKPKIGAFDGSSGTVPSNYGINLVFPSDLASRTASNFADALKAPSFSAALLDDGLNELLNGNKGSLINGSTQEGDSEDFMALDEPTERRTLSLEEQNSALKAELDALRRLQKVSFEKIENMSAEKKALLRREDKHFARSNGAGANGRPNGALGKDIDMADSSSRED